MLVLSLSACDITRMSSGNPAWPSATNNETQETDAPNSEQPSDAIKTPAPTDIPTTEPPTEPPTSEPPNNPPTDLGGTYWKAVKFDAAAADDSDYWSDLFLWEDGTGYFRFSQATEESGYWGYRDFYDCTWTLKNNKLTLAVTSNPSIKQTCTFEKSSLKFAYDGFGDDMDIIMEQAKMPPYGTHWTVPDLYGSWRMVSYTDKYLGNVVSENGIFTPVINNDDYINLYNYIYSEISIDTYQYADYTLETDSEFGEERYGMCIKRIDGELWKDCGNEAWYAQLVGDEWEDEPPIYVTYADGKLLMKKKNGAATDSFFESFTAVYERLDIDLQYDWHEMNEWVGEYTFNEYASPDQNMEYKISIKAHPVWSIPTVELEINGFQTEIKIAGWIFGNANYIEIVNSVYFTELMDSPSPSPLFRDFQIILTLHRKGDEIITTWAKLQPLLKENTAPGIYFEKRVTSSEFR